MKSGLGVGAAIMGASAGLISMPQLLRADDPSTGNLVNLYSNYQNINAGALNGAINSGDAYDHLYWAGVLHDQVAEAGGYYDLANFIGQNYSGQQIDMSSMTTASAVYNMAQYAGIPVSYDQSLTTGLPTYSVTLVADSETIYDSTSNLIQTLGDMYSSIDNSVGWDSSPSNLCDPTALQWAQQAKSDFETIINLGLFLSTTGGLIASLGFSAFGALTAGGLLFGSIGFFLIGAALGAVGAAAYIWYRARVNARMHGCAQ